MTSILLFFKRGLGTPGLPEPRQTKDFAKHFWTRKTLSCADIQSSVIKKSRTDNILAPESERKCTSDYNLLEEKNHGYLSNLAKISGGMTRKNCTSSDATQAHSHVLMGSNIV